MAICFRDFLTPVAWFEDRRARFQIISKYQGHLFSAQQVIWIMERRPGH